MQPKLSAALAAAFMIMCLGAAVGFQAAWQLVRSATGADDAAVGRLLFGTLVGLAGLGLLLGVLRGQRTFQLDHFLRFARKPKKGTAPAAEGVLLRSGKRVLPASWFVNPATGKPGLIRQLLKRLGPTWASSPFRRLVQGVCLILFLWLFFVVCWPYSARPQPAEQHSAGWQLEFRGQELVFRGGRAAAWDGAERLHVWAAPRPGASAESVGEFLLLHVEPQAVTLRPAQPLTDVQFDQLLEGGPWTLSDRGPDYWPRHYADSLAAKERVAAEIFLVLDPLVSLSTALAARAWVWSLICAGLILAVCILIPRGFCGYLCPLGTTIDLFDWSIGSRIRRFRVPEEGWWVHLKYYLLLGVLVSGLAGVLVSGYVAAIPVLTRGLLFLGEPLQTGLMRGWHQVPPLHAGHILSLVLFLGVLSLGFLQPRFWCKYVCPSGAVFSLGNLFRVAERKVESSCIHCNKCVEICPFDAIKPDFTTRVSDCTLCQTCGGVCPTHAIKFVERWNHVELKVLNDPPTGETRLGRRGFLSLAAGTAAAVAGGTALGIATGAHRGSARELPIRPPGSAPEAEFLDLCIRCGECFKVCPNNVLQAAGWEHGWESLWTPLVVADWAGCESSCNACGQVCPTAAIRPLPLEQKRVTRMGLAIVNSQTCLPLAEREECRLCVDECLSAGYDAIEQMRVGTKVDDQGDPVPDSGFLAPVVRADKCVGCGLCQTRCYGINVDERQLLVASAIVIQAGEGREDRA